jgi:hypothetical protein
VAIVVVSLASFVVLGLLVSSVVTVNSRPLQTVVERDAIVAVATAKKKPRDVNSQIAAATASMAANDFKQALVYAGNAAKLEPRDSAVNLVLAQALLGSGDLKKARATVQAIQKGNKKSSVAYAQASGVMADIDEAEGKLAAAVEDLQVAILADRTNTDLLVHLASLQARIGKKEDAAATYGAALQYIPDLQTALTALRAMKSGPADYQLAKVAWQAGNKDEAKRLMEQAAKESPKLAWIQVALGDFRHLIGDSQGARAAYEAALAIDPSNKEAKAGLSGLQ